MAVEIKVIGQGRCETRKFFQNMGLLPRDGVPNICATCQGNLPEGQCRAATAAVEFYDKQRKNDWSEDDQPIAY